MPMAFEASNRISVTHSLTGQLEVRAAAATLR